MTAEDTRHRMASNFDAPLEDFAVHMAASGNTGRPASSTSSTGCSQIFTTSYRNES